MRYKGHKQNHTYELCLNLANIKRTKTKSLSLATNGIYERFHITMKAECYGIIFRYRLYSGLSEIQRNTEQHLELYHKKNDSS